MRIFDLDRSVPLTVKKRETPIHQAVSCCALRDVRRQQRRQRQQVIAITLTIGGLWLTDRYPIPTPIVSVRAVAVHPDAFTRLQSAARLYGSRWFSRWFVCCPQHRLCAVYSTGWRHTQHRCCGQHWCCRRHRSGLKKELKIVGVRWRAALRSGPVNPSEFPQLSECGNHRATRAAD
jgi:hypothetical protein